MNPATLPKKQRARIEAALAKFGASLCLAAYRLNVQQGEGHTVIELETGIPDRQQSAAIAAGEFYFLTIIEPC